MFSVSRILLARTWGSRQLSIFIASMCLAAVLSETSASGAPSDTVTITYADGSPVIAHNGISVDYKIGSAATVTLQTDETLGPIDVPEPALETTGEGRLVVNIDGYLSFNSDIMVGLGSRSAYLTEAAPPGVPTAYSDIMQCVTRQNASNAIFRDFEFTLISDPDPALASANPLPGDLVLSESVPRDLSTGLFTASPNSTQTTAPFHVVVFSDGDVPEPGALGLMAMTGMAVLARHPYCGRQRRRMALL